MPRGSDVDWRASSQRRKPEAGEQWRAAQDAAGRRTGVTTGCSGARATSRRFMEFVEAADADAPEEAREQRAGMEPNEEILTELELS